MKPAAQILAEWSSKLDDSLDWGNDILSLIESVQQNSQVEIDLEKWESANDCVELHKELLEKCSKLQSERDALLAEKESWGNEFNAVTIVKDQLLEIQWERDEYRKALTFYSNPYAFQPIPGSISVPIYLPHKTGEGDMDERGFSGVRAREVLGKYTKEAK